MDLLIFCFQITFYISQGSETGGEDTIKIVGESLGLNNWQTVAAIIGKSLESEKNFGNLISYFSFCLPLRCSLWLVQLEISKEEAAKGQKEGRKEAG